MQEQAAVMARRARKVTAFETLREALAKNPGTGVTTDSIIDDLDTLRGPWPVGRDSEPHAGA
jgi:hypothetical protein